jgi:hypothetical protein
MASITIQNISNFVSSAQFVSRSLRHPENDVAMGMLCTLHHITEQAGVAATLWAYVREVLSSNLTRDTGYPDSGFVWFYTISPGKFQDFTSIRTQLHPSKILFRSPFISYSTVPSDAIGCDLETKRNPLSSLKLLDRLN